MDDVTIEDEFESNEHFSSRSKHEKHFLKTFSIFDLLNQQWAIVLLLSIVFLVFIYINRNRRRNGNYVQHQSREENISHTRYDDMNRIREKQQKAYEEQALRHAEEKKTKMENLKKSTDENSNRPKYRSSDHNPLTGQSNRGSGDSCSWRPSSRRKPAGG